MRKAFHQLGYIISNNAMKFNINYIQWPYSAPVVLDEEWQMTPICEMLSLYESFESYAFALDFMFDLELHMRMKLQVNFYDCGINE